MGCQTSRIPPAAAKRQVRIACFFIETRELYGVLTHFPTVLCDLVYVDARKYIFISGPSFRLCVLPSACLDVVHSLLSSVRLAVVRSVCRSLCLPSVRPSESCLGVFILTGRLRVRQSFTLSFRLRVWLPFTLSCRLPAVRQLQPVRPLPS